MRVLLLSPGKWGAGHGRILPFQTRVFQRAALLRREGKPFPPPVTWLARLKRGCGWDGAKRPLNILAALTIWLEGEEEAGRVGPLLTTDNIPASTADRRRRGLYPSPVTQV